MWHSSTKIPEKYPSALRAKIRLSKCKFYNDQDQPTECPKDWNRLCCIPIFAPTLYIQKAQIGLIWETVGLKIAGLREQQSNELTFL